MSVKVTSFNTYLLLDQPAWFARVCAERPGSLYQAVAQLASELDMTWISVATELVKIEAKCGLSDMFEAALVADRVFGERAA